MDETFMPPARRLCKKLRNDEKMSSHGQYEEKIDPDDTESIQ
jgi:hypothetical protein